MRLEARKRHVRLELALFRRLPGALHRLLHLRLQALLHLARLDADPHRAPPSPVAEVADPTARQGKARQMNAGNGGGDVSGMMTLHLAYEAPVQVLIRRLDAETGRS